MEGIDCLYQVKDKAAIITLNCPGKLNALTRDQYLLLGRLIARADQERDTQFTIFQSTGRYFSSGANPADLLETSRGELDSQDPHKYWLTNFVASNIYLTDVFHNHSKILIAALNGPVVGLSAALVALCDLIFVKDSLQTFLLMPFANLGLVAEGAVLATLFTRLGWSKASEALLLSKPITGAELQRLGFTYKCYDGQAMSTEEFNNAVHQEISHNMEKLHAPSVVLNKQHLKANRNMQVNAASSREVIRGFDKWIENVPQARFAAIMQKNLKHKL